MTTPPPDDDDDDEVIDRLDAGEPPRSTEEAQARAPYERLFERIRNLDEIDPPPGWEDRAMARWAAAKRARRVRIALGVTVAVGLAAAILVYPCTGPTTGPGLQVAVSAAPGAARRGAHAVGDVLHVRARVDRPHVELRVYLRTKLVVRCPGSEQCRRDASLVEIDWKLIEPGSYQIVVLSSATDIPPPAGTVDRDLLEADDAGASSTTETITIGP